MNKTAVLIDPRYREHDAAANHPEGPERIDALLTMLREYDRDLVMVAPRLATEAELLANHSRELVAGIKATAAEEHHMFDYDTVTCAATYEIARLAAGGVLTVLDAVMEEKARNGFALVRPPGHHAEADRAMGFCFFNNVAIGARYLRNKYGIERVLIMDWDVHHGNGTQRSFYAANDVLFISAHQYPHYPGTGAVDEVGVAGGLGFTVNLPFPAGFGDDEYAAAFAELVEPISRQFAPEFVLISAGFDCHAADPLGDMRVTEGGFARMTQALLAVARQHARGRCVAVLEGGYSLDALTTGVRTVLDELGDVREPQPARKDTAAVETIAAIKKVQRRFWDLS